MGLGSKVEIFNSALAKLGVEGVTSPTDSNNRARLCNQLYDICRRDVLRAHPWKFAKKQASLNLLATAPTFKYARGFQIPGDCLRTLETEYNDAPWEVYGNQIYTDESSIKLEYIYDCETVGLFDANFVEALAYRLAMDLAEPLTNSTAKANEMEKKYKWQLSQARSFNAQEGRAQQVQADDWLNSRF